MIIESLGKTSFRCIDQIVLVCRLDEIMQTVKKLILVMTLLLGLVTLAKAVILPPANLGAVPFDHDKFLQFAESNRADTVASGDAYYRTVDPNNQRTTIDEWKALNGFVEPLPSTTTGLAAMGITHALYRNSTDLGFVRNVYIRVKANGDVVALLENFASFGRTFNQHPDEVTQGCNTAFDATLPVAQHCTSGGIDGFEQRDLSGVMASVVMEYSAVTPGGAKFTQFYGYGNDGNRVSALDLTGRGKDESFPGVCATCHGGSPGSVDSAGNFIPPDLGYEGAREGNFGAGFLPWDPDLYEYHDPNGAGLNVGSGIYSRANQEGIFKELNQIVLTTNPTVATRELVEGWYGGAGLPNAFNHLFVPTGWSNSVADSTFYKTVIAPYCRACHVQRAFPEGHSNPNAQTNTVLDFNTSANFNTYASQAADTVFSRTTMPMALVTYDKFWKDSVAVQNFIDYLQFYIPTQIDAVGNTVAVMPGKPIAIPGSYEDQHINIPLQLDGQLSLSADSYNWTVTPSIGVILSNGQTATPTFIATTPGVYTVSLTVSRIATATRPADTSLAVTTIINIANNSLLFPFSHITYDSTILPLTKNERCSACHSVTYGRLSGVSQLSSFSSVQGDFLPRLLYKPAVLLADTATSSSVHPGGKVLYPDDNYFKVLRDWMNDGECESDVIGWQRNSLTNENTALIIDP